MGHPCAAAALKHLAEERIVDSDERRLLKVDHVDWVVGSEPAPGLAVSMALTLEGASLTFWRSAGMVLAAATRFHVFSDDRLVATLVATAGDADANGADKTPIGSLQVALADLPRPYCLQLVVCVRLPQASALQPVQWVDGDTLHELAIRDDKGFSNLVQNPASRIKDETQILFASVHCLARFPNSFWISAGAVCVIGYRIIHGKCGDSRVEDVFRSHLDRTLAMRTDVPYGVRMRWIISMRLIGAYVALHASDRVAARVQLREIVSFATNLPEWPSSLTNIMLAQYGLGYLALLDADKAAAASHFRDSINLFRYGCLVAQFPNAYSFGELGNALKVAEASFIGHAVCRLGSPIQDGNIAAVGTRVDPRMLPAPLGWLLPPLEPPPA